MSVSLLDYAKAKLLEGDLSMATAYYTRAIDEGIAPCVVNLRYLTKEYLVYPIEYEDSTRYFELLKELRELARVNPEYINEYRLAVNSLIDIRRLFLRSLSLFYYSDILVSSRDSVVLKEIFEFLFYLKGNKEILTSEEVYGFHQYVPNYNEKKFENDLNMLEVYCLNIALSYTAQQHSLYQGKRYSATTIDYGYFYSTTVTEYDSYYKCANLKPRLFLMGAQAYYYDWLNEYESKRKALGDFNSPKELRKELTHYVRREKVKDDSDKDFVKYAKQFEKNDISRDSWFKMQNEFGENINPLLKLMNKTKLVKKTTGALYENNVGSFEIKDVFTQKKFLGVCSMLAAGKGWKVDTVRFVTVLSSLLVVGLLVYGGLAIAMKSGYYFDVTVEKP